MTQKQTQQRTNWSKRFKDYNEYQRKLENRLKSLKEKARNSLVVLLQKSEIYKDFQSATPKYTWDWYLKWVSSILVLGAMSIRGIPELQQTI